MRGAAALILGLLAGCGSSIFVDPCGPGAPCAAAQYCTAPSSGVTCQEQAPYSVSVQSAGVSPAVPVNAGALLYGQGVYSLDLELEVREVSDSADGGLQVTALTLKWPHMGTATGDPHLCSESLSCRLLEEDGEGSTSILGLRSVACPTGDPCLLPFEVTVSQAIAVGAGLGTIELEDGLGNTYKVNF